MRNTRTLTLALASTALLMVAGCSKAPSDKAATQETAADAASAAPAAREAADAAGASLPDIGGAAAPGVAFTYSYAFTLPAKAISDVQQKHAMACERLGTSRCRITGMTFEQPNADEASARLDFLLAPDIAHRFGADAVDAVEKADGALDHALVNGENAGDDIVLSQENSAAIQAEVERLQARLNAKGLTSAERVELTGRIEQLQQQLQGEAQNRRDKEASIATTPVSFTYASQGIAAGGGGFSKAASASWASFSSLMTLLMIGLGYALPWLLPLAGLIMFLRFRKAKRLLTETAADAHSPAAPAGPAPAA
ncbi:MAG: DUF4349 domain-containing protein [Novosphingobium sp.]